MHFSSEANILRLFCAIYTDDLAIITANWLKTDANLSGDCPRDE